MQIFLIVLGVLCLVRALHLSINKVKLSESWPAAWFHTAIMLSNLFLGTLHIGFAVVLFIAAAYLK